MWTIKTKIKGGGTGDQELLKNCWLYKDAQRELQIPNEFLDSLAALDSRGTPSPPTQYHDKTGEFMRTLEEDKYVEVDGRPDLSHLCSSQRMTASDSAT